MNKVPRIIVVTGSYPDVGKGIFSSALGYLLKTFGYSVQMLKFDGYLNVSSGSMNPYHRTIDISYSEEEVFVLADGYQADADSGYYERFLHEPFFADSNITNGQLFNQIINLGTVGEILNYRAMRNLLKKRILNPDFCDKDFLIIEVGGTVGDRESEIMFECLSLLQQQEEIKMFPILMSPCFYEKSAPGTELSFRSKIIRQSYEKLWRLGLAPKAIVLRQKNNNLLEKQDLEYIAIETGLSPDKIFIDKNQNSIYDLPASLRKQKLPELVMDYFCCNHRKPNDKLIEKYAELLNNRKIYPVKKIAIFGKTMSYDTYVSLIEAVFHSAIKNKINPEIIWLDDSKDWKQDLKKCSALIIGEGLDNSMNKIESLKLAYAKNIPTLALSFGINLMMKSIVNLNIEELGDKEPDIKNEKMFSGSLCNERLRISSIPRKNVLPIIKDDFDVVFIDDVIFEIMGKNKTYFMGTIYHPEFNSWPMLPHRTFDDLMKYAKQYKNSIKLRKK